MKVFWLTLSVVMLGASVSAQTNLPSSSAPTLSGPTQIHSDTGYFEFKTRLVVYRDNVRVENPQMKLWCDLLTTTAPTTGKHIESIVAERNVVIDMLDENGQTNHATGDKLVYTYNVSDGVTNEATVLTGNPILEKPDFTITGDTMTWDHINNRLRVTNHKTIFHTDAVSGTNQPPTPEKSPVNP